MSVNERDQILDEVKRMEPDPPRSKLDDYAEIIWELRRKRKRIYAITEFLAGHGIRVGKSTVARWLKAHPVPKANAAGRQIDPASLTPEARERSKSFFNQSTDSTHETTTRPYNIG